ncbi:MAG: PAS domain-containing protein, partial [Verrucomicrobia bacterium]|nr:PAS domain-containing protein [Cytophagales bacterium]
MPFKENPVDFNRKLLELMPNMLYIYDIRQEKIVYINHRVKDLLGYEVDEFLGMTLATLIPYDSQQVLRETFENFMQTRENEVIEYEYQFLHKNNTYRFIKTQGTVFKRDEKGIPVLIMGISDDVTEEKQRLDKYQKNQFLLAEAEKMMHFGSWDWNLETDEIYWSEGLFQIFGYTNPKERPQKINYELYLSHVHPSEKELASSVIKEVLENKQPLA